MSTIREPQAKQQVAQTKQANSLTVQNSDLPLEESSSGNLHMSRKFRRAIELRPTNVLSLQRIVGNRAIEKSFEERSISLYNKYNSDTYANSLQRNESIDSAVVSEKLAAIQGLPMYELLPALAKISEDILNNVKIGHSVGGPRLVLAMQAARAKREGTVASFLEYNSSVLLGFETTNPDQVSNIRVFLGLIANPKTFDSFEAWLQSFPNYTGAGDINITENAPPDLKNLINGDPKLPPDCADVSILLRHYYLKANGSNFTVKAGSRKFTIGRNISDNKVKQNMLALGSVNFQEDRKGFSMVKFYKSGSKKNTNLKSLIVSGLKPGDVLVWKRLPSISGHFEGHVQTIQHIDMNKNMITVVQGNMVAGKGVGALQQRQYSFKDLTGSLDGDGNIRDASEESFFGAGPWRN